MSNNSRACGVDFGTSNSTVGVVRAGAATLLPLEADKTTLPSVVFFNVEEERVALGRAALDDYLEGYEGRLMRSLKSLLGTRLMDGHTEVAGRQLKFTELLALFLAGLKARAEAAAGQSFPCAVFGRPVHFVDDDAAADRLAQETLARIAREVGFGEVAFQFEPIAAAFDYERQVAREELVLVIDIGGGTSDFTLIRLSPERAHRIERHDDILANCGVHIGGTDFDRALSLACAMPLLGMRSRLKSGMEMPASQYFDLATWHTINFAYSRQAMARLKGVYPEAEEPYKLDRLFDLVAKRAGHWLAMQVEAAKIALSTQAEARLDLGDIERGLGQALTRETFDAAVLPLVDSIGAAVSATLKGAGVAAQQVDTVFFTGGASGMPLLRARLGALLPQARQVEGDLHGSIGSGLALDAARRFA